MKYSSFLIGSIVILVMLLISQSTRKNPPMKVDGSIVLKLSKAFDFFAYFALFITLFIGVAASLESTITIDDLIPVIGLVTAFLLSAGFALYFSKMIYISYTDIKMKSRNLAGKTATIQWDEINKVYYNKSWMLLSIYSNKARINLSAYLVGFPNFVDVLVLKTDPKCHQNAIADMKSVRIIQ